MTPKMTKIMRCEGTNALPLLMSHVDISPSGAQEVSIVCSPCRVEWKPVLLGFLLDYQTVDLVCFVCQNNQQKVAKKECGRPLDERCK